MRVNFSLIAVVFLSLGFIGSTPAEAQTNSYFPLESGLHFSFTTHLDGSPEEFVTVIGMEQYFGQTVWALQWNYLDSPAFRIEFYSIAADGDVLFHGARTTFSRDIHHETVLDPPMRILDMPASPGHTWMHTYSVLNYVNGTLDNTVHGYSFSGEILSEDDPVTVPAGTFSALAVATVLVVAGDIATYRTNSWYVKDIGTVRRDSRTDGLPAVASELLWAQPLALENRSWGSIKSLFR